MKNILRNGAAALLCLLIGVPAGFAAAAETGDQGGSLLLVLFIGFFALIVVFQLVPACLLFIGMLKGLFSREQKGEEKKSQV